MEATTKGKKLFKNKKNVTTFFHIVQLQVHNYAMELNLTILTYRNVDCWSTTKIGREKLSI